MRALACMGVYDEVSEGRWASNAISEKLADSTFGTFAMGLCVMSPDTASFFFLHLTSMSDPEHSRLTAHHYPPILALLGGRILVTHPKPSSITM